MVGIILLALIDCLHMAGCRWLLILVEDFSDWCHQQEARHHKLIRSKLMDARKIDRFRMDPSAVRAKIFAMNEARLKSFYRSGEPETTQNYKFINIIRPVTRNDFGKRGCGLSLNERAAPGQLLVVSNAIASCACIREHTPYKSDSYSPKVAWLPRRTRIPLEVHQHLAIKLARICWVDNNNRVKIFHLNSHDPNSSYGSQNSSTRDEPGTSASHESKPDDLEQRVWNIVANNAMCNKVRSLREDEPSLVETCHFWGVWLRPSFINHSCAPNCHRMVVGKAMFIRSATEIAAGEELTLPYFDIFEPLYIRDAYCQTFGFRCECRRCKFERSIGKSYYDIQTQILVLKFKVQHVWKINGKNLGSGKDNDLLEQLADELIPINRMIVKILCSLRTKRSNEKLNHLFMTQNLIEESGEFLEPGLDRMSIEESWIHASFIDAWIALYVIFVTRPDPSLGENGLDLLCSLGRSASQDEGEQSEHRVIVVVREIVDTLNHVHPGNLLGQEFYSTIVTVLTRFLESEPPDLNVAYYRSQLQYLETNGMLFYSRYYGYIGAPILKLLLATKS